MEWKPRFVDGNGVVREIESGNALVALCGKTTTNARWCAWVGEKALHRFGFRTPEAAKEACEKFIRKQAS